MHYGCKSFEKNEEDSRDVAIGVDRLAMLSCLNGRNIRDLQLRSPNKPAVLLFQP